MVQKFEVSACRLEDHSAISLQLCIPRPVHMLLHGNPLAYEQATKTPAEQSNDENNPPCLSLGAFPTFKYLVFRNPVFSELASKKERSCHEQSVIALHSP